MRDVFGFLKYKYPSTLLKMETNMLPLLIYYNATARHSSIHGSLQVNEGLQMHKLLGLL